MKGDYVFGQLDLPVRHSIFSVFGTSAFFAS